jgi:hypothetical protein
MQKVNDNALNTVPLQRASVRFPRETAKGNESNWERKAKLVISSGDLREMMRNEHKI